MTGARITCFLRRRVCGERASEEEEEQEQEEEAAKPSERESSHSRLFMNLSALKLTITKQPCQHGACH
ncbi:hypothetical protein J1614_004147 [Plenodomus biglobosus]|nr:hypothetical protein J1614_004147 [Plenodomus biglobosus]